MLQALRIHAVKLLVGVLILLLAAFVWPTPYHYLTWHTGDFTTPVRISRFTGQADYLLPDGWRRMAPQRTAPPRAVQPARDELSEIEAALGIDSAIEARIKARAAKADSNDVLRAKPKR